MACCAAESEPIEPLVAPPLTRVTAVPKSTPSIWNCTAPVGVVPAICGVTVAWNVAAWPRSDGLAEAVTATVVVAASRVVTGAHFLSDVLVGAGIALVASRETLFYLFPGLGPSWF